MTNRTLLDNVAHQGLRLATRHGPEFGDSVNQMLIFPTEFEEVQREFPIFLRKDDGGAFQAVALLGLDRDENLFLGPDGWTSRYIPAAQRRGPFLIGMREREVDGELRRQPLIHVDLDDPRIGETEGEPLFLPQGGTAPALERASSALRTIHQGMAVKDAMIAAFEELGLVERVSVEIKLNDAKEYQLSSFHTIDEEKLGALDGAALERLHKAGFLKLAVFVVSSLRNVTRLIEMKNRKNAGVGGGMMAGAERETRVVRGVAPDAIPYAELMEAQRPVVLKGVARDWPLVRASREGPASAVGYLKSFYGGRPVVGYTGAPEIKGRYFYNEDVTGLNFEAARVPLDEYLDRMLAHADDGNPPSFYVGSTDLEGYLPGLGQENGLLLGDPMFAANPPLVSIWIGNRTVASAHYDMSNNIACVMAGRRRFTLFPPGEVENLYPGPLELTPGGQVVSMVDFRDPDFDRYPRFREALAAAEVAEMEPGDILFYPALWWHHVEALDAFNVMINYWWNTSPKFIDTPQNTLLHALLSLRDRPEPEKRAWRALFDYYVFGPAERPAAHLPEQARGNLAPMDEMKARRLRALLLNKLNR